jgi:hypothetical protein
MGIFDRWRAKAKDALSAEEAVIRLAKVERAVELRLLDLEQAQVNDQESLAIARLIESLAEIPEACIVVGSLVLVKLQRSGQPVFLSRSLSPREMKALERFPELHKDPGRFFEALSLAVSELDTPESL